MSTKITARSIAARNAIRAEAKLPLVDIALKLAQAARIEQAAAFDNWAEQNRELRRRIEAKVLARARRKRGDPNWWPSGYLSGGGLSFGLVVRKVLKRIYRMRQSLDRRGAGGRASGPWRGD
jgi:hypothetical protein